MLQTIETTQKMKMIPCIKCGSPMPELRLTKFGYNFCVNCSTVGTKRGVPVMRGSGDHTWTETVIMTDSQYNSLKNKYLNNLNSGGVLYFPINKKWDIKI